MGTLIGIDRHSYSVDVSLEINTESASSPGVLALMFAAQDELDRRYGDDSDPSSLTAQQFTPPRGSFVIARHDGHLAGGVGVRRIGPPTVFVGEIKRLWVRPDLRRRGVAEALMTRVEQCANELGMTQLYLEVGHRQPEARAFYVKHGWRPDAAFPDGADCHPLSFKLDKSL